jgi:nucleoside-diphosphate-sugar epimerase
MTRLEVRKVALTSAQMERLQVGQERSMREGMAAIDYVGLGLALIVDEQRRVVGLVTDGDIRRAILRGISIATPLVSVMNRSPVIAREDDEKSGWGELLSRDIQPQVSEEVGFKVPVVDHDNRFVEILLLRKRDQAAPSSTTVRPVKGVLVVGGAGYLGSVLCRMLLQRGYRVRVLDNLLYGADSIAELTERPGFELVKADMRHLEQVTRAMKSVDAVIHLAAIVGDEASRLDPEETIEANHLATRAVAEVSRYYQVNRFIFASTCSNYGASSEPDASLDEDAPLNPLSLYARMKVESEQALRELEDGNFAPTTFRMATLFGLSPRMRFDLVVNNFSVRAMKEKSITVFGGKQWRPQLHVSDAAEAFMKCLDAPIERVRGQIFNVGGNTLNCRIQDIAKLVAEEVPGARMIVQSENVDPRSYRVGFDKVERVLGFRPRVNVRDGVREIIEAVKAGGFSDWPNPRYSNAMYLGAS